MKLFKIIKWRLIKKKMEILKNKSVNVYFSLLLIIDDGDNLLH